MLQDRRHVRAVAGSYAGSTNRRLEAPQASMASRSPFVLKACGHELQAHHNAAADALALVDIMQAVATREGAVGIDGLAGRFRLRVGHMAAGVYHGSVCTLTSQQRLTRAEVNPAADPDGWLYDRVVVITGKLMSMSRQMAWDEVVRVGGIPELNTTRRTNVLVIGDLNPAVLRPGCTLCGRARKAFQLQDAGQDIELMTEDDFLRTLDPAGVPEIPVT